VEYLYWVRNMNNRIREILREKGMTQKELESITGIAQSEISRIINDHKPSLSLAVAKRIAKALDRNVEQIWPD